MSDIKFSCPQCGQHITCDELAMGQSVACPGCQQTIVVPQMASAPSLVPTPPPTQPRITINRTAHQAAAPGAPPPARPMPVYRTFAPEPEKKSVVKKVITIAVTVAAFGVGGYFGFNWVYHLQQKTNAQMAEAAKNSDGGEMGETAAIYKTLDATDPDKMHSPSLPGLSRLAHRNKSGVTDASTPIDESDDAAATKSAGNDLPIVPAAWNLDINSATIPEGRVNGSIGGTPFVADLIRFDTAQTYQVLRFTQGSLTSPDREVLVYLHLKTGESPAGNTLLVTSDSHVATNPSITKRWKTDPKYAPQSKSFATGYALKIEFTGLTPGALSGKIYLALPDAEKTVVAGVFRAQTSF